MRAFAFFGLLLISAPAFAAETITYTYDARGRLVKVVRSGTVNDGVVTDYVIDKANNRTNKTVTGPPQPAAALIRPSTGENTGRAM